MKDLLTIICVSCDEYADMWPNFFKCKQRYWPDCEFETVLVNNELIVDISGIKVINCGINAQWSTRTRMALEQINTKYVCFMLEDFWISKKVDNSLIAEVLNTMEDDGLKYYKLDSFSKIKTRHYKSTDHLYEIPSTLKYGISLLTAIWDREYFLQMLGKEDYNPWLFEASRNKEVAQSQTEKLLGVYDNRDILHICHMVVQGHYLPVSAKKMIKQGIVLNTEKRKVYCGIAYWKYRVKKAMSQYPNVKKILNILGWKSISDKNS